jgi:UDP-N-acetylmuramate--alanine ligase
MHKKIHFHFMGIGGIGMSSLATIIQQQGHTVSGCDLDLNEKNLKILMQKQTSLSREHCSEICNNPSIDVLVYTTAILHNNPSHPELLAARKKGIPVIQRATLLAEIMRKKSGVAIAGSHGKTTTTALISHIALEALLDPTIIIGGHLQNIGGHVYAGAGEYCIAEADESDRSLLELPFELAVINNISREHLETYQDVEDVKETFLTFINNTPFFGRAFLNFDDQNIRSLLPKIKVNYGTYAIETDADLQAKNIQLHPEYSTFDLYEQGLLISNITMPMPGMHNIYNCLAAISLAREMAIPEEQIKQAIGSFKGVVQRFTFCGIISHNNVEVFDDYGHHPREIECTLQIAKNRTRGRLIVLFQPHRYSRTKHLWNDFVSVFKQAPIDHLVITDIFPASEPALPAITSDRLVEDINMEHVYYFPQQPDFSQIVEHLNKNMQPNDLLLLLGAGKINKIAKELIS